MICWYFVCCTVLCMMCCITHTVYCTPYWIVYRMKWMLSCVLKVAVCIVCWYECCTVVRCIECLYWMVLCVLYFVWLLYCLLKAVLDVLLFHVQKKKKRISTCYKHSLLLHIFLHRFHFLYTFSLFVHVGFELYILENIKAFGILCDDMNNDSARSDNGARFTFFFWRFE